MNYVGKIYITSTLGLDFLSLIIELIFCKYERVQIMNLLTIHCIIGLQSGWFFGVFLGFLARAYEFYHPLLLPLNTHVQAIARLSKEALLIQTTFLTT